MSMTIDEVIAMAEANNGYCGEDGIRYLQEYREMKRVIFPLSISKAVAFKGMKPLVKINGEYYLVRRYLPNEDHWLLERQDWHSDAGGWSNADDFDWIFDRFGNLVRVDE